MKLEINMRERKGITPVIATVLLIGVVVILAGIVFLWARGFVKDAVQKGGEPIEQSCTDVQFEALIVNTEGVYSLEISNQADIELYGVNLKVKGEGEVIVHDIGSSSLGLGESKIISLSNENIVQDGEYLVVPILLGARGEQREAYVCGDEFGVEARVV